MGTPPKPRPKRQMKKICEKCKRELSLEQFYKKKSGERDTLCKKCLCMHLDNLKPDTYLWILERLDYPYIEREWSNILNKQYNSGAKIQSTSIIGRYLINMNLAAYKEYHYKDSEKLNEHFGLSNNEQKEKTKYNEELKERLERGEITEAEYKTLRHEGTYVQQAMRQNTEPTEEISLRENEKFNEENFLPEEQMPDLAAELTQEDKMYLATKWGRLHTPNEWVSLEKSFMDMKNSFCIEDNDIDTLNSLVLLCKTNLELNKALDEYRFDDYKKLFSSSTDLRKTCNFTASQTKEEDEEEAEDDLDSVGMLVKFCEETKGRIPEFKIETPLDIVDNNIQDIEDTLQSFIREDPSLATQAEAYLKKKVALEGNLDEEMRKEEELKKAIEQESQKMLEEQKHLIEVMNGSKFNKEKEKFLDKKKKKTQKKTNEKDGLFYIDEEESKDEEDIEFFM